MKKMQNKGNNKGFSLVELIVVIAIMAVLVAVLAPQFTKYVDRSRQSNDAATVAGIVTAAQTGIADKTEYYVPTGTYTITVSATETKVNDGTKDIPAVEPDDVADDNPKNISNAIEDACGALADLEKTASKWTTIIVEINVAADSSVTVKYDSDFAAYIGSTDTI